MSETTKITETTRRGLEAVNPRLADQHDRIVALLRARLGPDHAFLFAEPVGLGGATPDGREIAWFVPGPKSGRPLTALDSSDSKSVRLRCDQLVGEISGLAEALEREGGASREFASLLRDALVIPDESGIWAVEGRPVLVDWGYRHTENAGALRSGPEVLAGAPHPIPAERTAGPERRASSGVSPEPPNRTRPGPAQAGQRISFVPRTTPTPVRQVPVNALLWLVFVALLVGIARLLLDACGVGGESWPQFVRAVLPDRCPTVLASGSDPASAAFARQVEAQIHESELLLARKVARCENACVLPEQAPGRRPEVPSPPMPPSSGGAVTPSVSPIPNPVPSPDKERLKGVARGRYELTLEWEGAADLDLVVDCPAGGEISFRRKAECGGRLVSDLNVGGGTAESKPIEHIVWDAPPTPAGSYSVKAMMYDRHGDRRERIPYRVYLRVNNDVIRSAQGDLAAERTLEPVFIFESTLER